MSFDIAGNSLGQLIVEVGTDLSKLRTGLTTAQEQIRKAGTKMAGDLEAAGRKMVVAGTVITGALGMMVKGAGDFSQEIANVITLVDDFDGTIRKKFTAGVEDLAIKFGESKNQLSKSLFDIQSATGDTTTAISKLEAATKLAVGGNSNLVDSTSGLLTLMETYGKKLKGAADGADLLFKAQIYARATVGQLAVASGEFIPIAGQLNIKVEELFATYSKLTLALGNTSESATALTGFFNAFMKPTEELTRLIKTWKDETTGLNFVTARQAIESLGLVGVLKKLEKVDKDGLEKIVGRIQGLKGLFAATTDVAWIEEKSIEIGKRKGALDKAVTLQMQEFNRQCAISREKIASLFEAIGNQLLPTLINLLNIFNSTVIKIREWVKNHGELTKKIIIGTAAFGAFLIVLGTASIIFANVIRGLLLITSPVGILISVLALLATAWYKNWGNIQEYTWAVARNIGKRIDEIISSIVKMAGFMYLWINTPLKDKILHPIQSITAAWKKSSEVYEQMINGDTGITKFGDLFSHAVDKAIDKTAEFKAAMAGLTQIPTSTDIGSVSVPELKIETLDELTERLAAEQTLRDEAIAKEEAANRKRIADNYAAETSIFNFWVRLKQIRIEAEKNDAKTRQLIQQQSYDQFVSLLEQASAESKTAATILKAVRIGEAIANTATGVTQALAAYPPPMSFVMASLVSALGAAQVALISGVKFAMGTDTVPSMLSPGETVIPRTFADAIRQGRLTLSGPEKTRNITENNPITINITDVTISSTLDIDDIAEQLGTNIQKKMRSK